MSRSRVPRFLSLIYVHNPFYLISACLFVYGLKLLFRAGNSAVLFERGTVSYMEPWGLMASFGGVTLLMAVTAILIVRLGKVWEDARSVVLIVLLMLLAISVSFDEIITVLSDSDTSRSHLVLMFGVGVTFAAGVVEFLIRGLGIRLASVYRIPLHGFLLLFFLWPTLLLPEVTGFSELTTQSLVALFPTVAGAIAVCLLPGIRMGKSAVTNNGTPWSWPLFPWTPFVFIGLAVLFRAYSLTMSYDAGTAASHYWDTTFGVYQLVPFFVAILLILLEIGVVHEKPGLQRAVMLLAPITIVLSYPWLVPWSHLSMYRSFSCSVTSQFASPVFVSIICVGALYAWAWKRRVRHAELGCYAMLFLACTLSPQAFGRETWSLNSVEFQWWPLFALACLQIVLGFRANQSLRVFAGLLLGVLATYLALGQSSDLIPWRGFVCVHLLLAAVLLVGVSLSDEFAAAMKESAALGIPAAMIVGMLQIHDLGCPAMLIMAYGAAMTLLAGCLYLVLKVPGYLWVVCIHTGIAATGTVIWVGWLFADARLPSGVKPVALGAFSFFVAVLISILKSGLARRLRLFWLNRQRIRNSQRPCP